MLRRLEQKFSRYAIPNVTLYIVLGQVFFFLAIAAEPDLLNHMELVPRYVFTGEVWRLLTFLLIPPTMSPIFLIFALYLFWLMGSALESNWGALRYNLFLIVGVIGSFLAAMVDPTGAATNVYLLGSVFFAFAILYPDFQLLLFFVLPVPVKWLALLAVAGYVYQMATGTLQDIALVLVAFTNVLLFFWRELLMTVRHGHRRMIQKTTKLSPKSDVFHRCTTCGRTDKSDPQLEFRYCPQCAGTPCYCIEHIRNHEHK